MTPLPVTPNRDLGQHFLVDGNILSVLERLAGLDQDDVVLEVGPGLGVLTSFLAARVALVHAVELDRRLEPLLRDAIGPASNVSLTFGDALRVPLADLEPSPTKLVANLPYSIATPLCVESLDGLPTVRTWCVMLQREVADRFVASPGTRAYGAVSVLVQLTARQAGFHPVSRTCFQPPPNVDSALLALHRTRDWEPGYAMLKRMVQGAFGHRRKTLPNALALSGIATRSDAERALSELGLAGTTRAEALPPQQFLRLAELLG